MAEWLALQNFVKIDWGYERALLEWQDEFGLLDTHTHTLTHREINHVVATLESSLETHAPETCGYAQSHSDHLPGTITTNDAHINLLPKLYVSKQNNNSSSPGTSTRSTLSALSCSCILCYKLYTVINLLMKVKPIPSF